MSELDAWLGARGLALGTRIGAFVVQEAALRRSRLELSLSRAGASVTVHLAARDPEARAFARTASFDLSYVPVPEEHSASTLELMHQLTARIAARDEGGLTLPPSPPGAPPEARPAFERSSIPRDAHDFVFVDVDAADSSRHADAMHAMFERKLDAMIIRNVFGRAQMAAITSELERPGATFDWVDNTQSDERDHLQPYNLGQVLIPTRTHPAGVPLERYFRGAAAFRATCRGLFARSAGHDFEARVEEVLRSVAGGRSVSIPRGPEGEPYTPATIRAVPPRAELAVHVGNYFKDCDAYWHLRTFVELADQLSYFVPLSLPESGGEIEIFSLEWHHRPRTPKGDLDVDAIARESPSVKYHPGAGDMFLFDGGRFYHRVCRTGGERTRWTIGGFVTISKAHDQYFYWS